MQKHYKWVLKNKDNGYGDCSGGYTKKIDDACVYLSRSEARGCAGTGDVPVKVTVKITEIK